MTENLGMLLREHLRIKGYDVDLQPDGEAGLKLRATNTIYVFLM